MTKSAVIIVPGPHRDAANGFCAAQGWQPQGADPGTFCVALTNGSGAPTHYACRPDLTPEHEAILANPPPGAGPLLAVIDMDIRDVGPSQGGTHFREVIAARGLNLWTGKP